MDGVNRSAFRRCAGFGTLNGVIRPACSQGADPTMDEFTREQLHAFLDDGLPDADSARIESALRSSDELQQRLKSIMQERDRGEHSLGAIWRRDRLTCVSREQLGAFLLDALDPDVHEYIDFHLDQIACPYCRANLDDLKALQAEAAAKSQQRRKKIFKSSAGYLSGPGK